MRHLGQHVIGVDYERKVIRVKFQREKRDTKVYEKLQIDARVSDEDVRRR